MSRSSKRDSAETIVGPAGERGPAPTMRMDVDLVDEGEIGTGGSGSVRRALDPTLRRRVAVKALWPRLAERPRAVARFVQEAQITAQLEHPNVVPIHALGVDGAGRPYFSMRLVQGRTLAAVIADGGTSSPDPEQLHERLQLFLKICDAVAFAHSHGVIHCDVKPENIMVGAYGEAYLMDWGVAVADAGPEDGGAAPADPARARRPAIKGTPAYMSPEQAQGDTDALGVHTDVFGLGGVLYMIVTGRAPFDAPRKTESLARARRCAFESPAGSPGGANAPGLVRIILRAMAPRPADRYPGVLDLRRDVDQFLRGGWHLPTRQFPPGAVVVAEGDPGDAAYLIVDGTCEVLKRSDAGESRVLRRIGPGAVFGEMAILSGGPRSATVRAVDAVTVKVVTKELLHEQLGAATWLGKLVLALVDRLKEAEASRARDAST